MCYLLYFDGMNLYLLWKSAMSELRSEVAASPVKVPSFTADCSSEALSSNRLLLAMIGSACAARPIVVGGTPELYWAESIWAVTTRPFL